MSSSASPSVWLRLFDRLSLGVTLEVVILLAGWYGLLRFMHRAADLYLQRYERHTLAVRRLTRLVELCVWIGMVPASLLRILQPDNDMMLAIAGAGAVAFGLAMKDLAAGAVASVIITLDHPFQIGDYIEIGPYAGEVISIGLRSTTIVSLDDNAIHIPNATFLSETVSKANDSDLSCQVVTHFYLAHEASYDQVKTILWEAAATSKYVAIDKPIGVVSKELPFGTRYSVKAYVADHRYMTRFASDIAESAKHEFRVQGVPYASVKFTAGMEA